MPGFSSLRIVPFEPRFHWEPSLGACADRINRPHEDYPRYVGQTARAIEVRRQKPAWPCGNIWPHALDLQGLHWDIFEGKISSLWRETEVMVGLHKAPPWQQVERLMGDLAEIYADLEPTPERIREWYIDFETIHPYIDGNGRVGGCVVTLMMDRYHPDKQHRLYTPGAGTWTENAPDPR